MVTTTVTTPPTENEYVVVFYAGGNDGLVPVGQVPDTITLVDGESFVLPPNTLTLDSYVFDSYYDGKNNYMPGDTYTINGESVAMLAIWAKESKGGSGGGGGGGSSSDDKTETINSLSTRTYDESGIVTLNISEIQDLDAEVTLNIPNATKVYIKGSAINSTENLIINAPNAHVESNVPMDVKGLILHVSDNTFVTTAKIEIKADGTIILKAGTLEISDDIYAEKIIVQPEDDAEEIKVVLKNESLAVPKIEIATDSGKETKAVIDVQTAKPVEVESQTKAPVAIEVKKDDAKVKTKATSDNTIEEIKISAPNVSIDNTAEVSSGVTVEENAIGATITNMSSSNLNLVNNATQTAIAGSVTIDTENSVQKDELVAKKYITIEDLSVEEKTEYFGGTSLTLTGTPTYKIDGQTPENTFNVENVLNIEKENDKISATLDNKNFGFNKTVTPNITLIEGKESEYVLILPNLTTQVTRKMISASAFTIDDINYGEKAVVSVDKSSYLCSGEDVDFKTEFKRVNSGDKYEDTTTSADIYVTMEGGDCSNYWIKDVTKEQGKFVVNNISYKISSTHYKVTLKLYDEVTDSVGVAMADNKITSIANPTRSGYEFKGWYSEESLENEIDFPFNCTNKDNTILYAKWERVYSYYDVTFDTNGGSAVEKELHISDETAYEPTATSTKTGYVFAGWYKEAELENEFTSEILSGDITLYAKWTADDFEVTFDANGGEGTMLPQTITYKESTNLSANAFTKSWATFAGWSTTENGKVEYVNEASYQMNTEGVTLYAIWTAIPITYNTITYNSNGGTTIEPKTVETGVVVAEPTQPTKEGHMFDGWYEDQDFQKKYDFTKPLTNNITLYAKWNEDVGTEGLVYKLINSGTEYEVSDYNGDDVHVVIPAKYNELPVTRIGDIALAWNDDIESVKILDGVTVIGERVFQDCESLENVIIPKTVTSIGEKIFDKCKNLKSITIPEGITSIPTYAFKDCISLNTISIPSSVTSIDAYAFDNCYSITTITVSEENDAYKSVDGHLFNKDGTELVHYSGGNTNRTYRIPSNVTKIKDLAFNALNHLNRVTVPSTVSSIDNNAFVDSGVVVYFEMGELEFSSQYKGARCYFDVKEDDIIVVDGIEYLFRDSQIELAANIGDEEVIEIPRSVEFNNTQYEITDIPSYAFKNSHNLKRVIIEDNIGYISRGAFWGCDNLQSVRITMDWGNGYSAPEIGEVAFDSNKAVFYFNQNHAAEDYLNYGRHQHFEVGDEEYALVDDAEYLISNKEALITNYLGEDNSFVIPNTITYNGNEYTVTKIADYAFSDIGHLESITIPTSVWSIGDHSFADCCNLTNIIMEYERYYKNIGDFAFAGCVGLKNITLEKVNTIGECAFSGCENLTNINMSDEIWKIDRYAFNNCSKLESITIPKRVKEIGERAFFSCDNLESVYITDIGAWCQIQFADSLSNPANCCGKLYLNGELVKDLVIPEGVTEIKNLAFIGCDSIESIKLPESLEKIGRDAFFACNNLRDLTILCRDVSIDSGAFKYSDSLENVYIENMETWWNISFSYDYANPMQYASNIYLNGESIVNIVVPDNTIIGNYKFYNWRQLESVRISDGVEHIYNYAFSKCDNVVIYAEAEIKQPFWDNDWNCSRPVYYGINEDVFLQENGVNYLVSDSNEQGVNTATVVGKYKPDVEIQPTITIGTTTYDVTAIASGVIFSGCVKIPSSVTEIPTFPDEVEVIKYP